MTNFEYELLPSTDEAIRAVDEQLAQLLGQVAVVRSEES